MHRLAVPIPILALVLAFGCARERPDEAAEIVPDTMAVPADSVSEWVRQGETRAVRTPNGKACVYVRESAIVGLGDSVRFTIKRTSPADSLLASDPDLPPGFRAAKQAGWTVFPPIYDFRAHTAGNEEIVQFPDTLIFAMCVVYDRADSVEFRRALLARDPEDPESALQLLAWKEPPAECDLNPSCTPRGSESPAQQRAVSLGRWLTGSPVVATPAHAAQPCTTCLKGGIGGGGTSNSPFAAVDTVPTRKASETRR